MKYAAVGLAVGLAMLTVLVRGQQKTDPALDRLSAEFVAAIAAKDAARVAALYADDAVLMPPDEGMFKGRRAIQSYFERGFQEDATNFRVTPIESATSGSQAFEAGSSQITLGSGPPFFNAIIQRGKYVVIYKRAGNEWKIAYDIFNTDN